MAVTNVARFLWMTKVLGVTANDRILEIGCGVGFAVEQIAPRLNDGVITAMDRSASMIDKAGLRNEGFVREKKAEFILADLSDFSPGSKKYNKIFASNVNLFWTRKNIQTELHVVKTHLHVRGRLYLFYQPPARDAFDRIVKLVGANLKSYAFTITDTVYENDLNCCCIISRPE